MEWKATILLNRAAEMSYSIVKVTDRGKEVPALSKLLTNWKSYRYKLNLFNADLYSVAVVSNYPNSTPPHH